MSRSARIYALRILLIATLLLGSSCTKPGDVPACKAGANDAAISPVQAVDIVPGADKPAWKDKTLGTATLPLTVTATVPCIRGGTRARLTTSLGTIGSTGTAGTPVNIPLSPVGGATDGKLEGYTALVLPVGREARVNVEVDSVYLYKKFSVSLGQLPALDAGVTSD